MVYKNGRHTYTSKKEYLNVLGIAFSIFFVCTFFITLMKSLVHPAIYFISIAVGILMMIHLILKYEYAIGNINEYKFNQY